MEIYIINLVLISILAILLYLIEAHNTKRGKLIFLSFSTIQLILLNGLRSEIVGADTTSYLIFFNNLKNQDMQTVLSGRLEMGFSFFSKLLVEIGFNERMFLFAVSAAILIPVAIFIYKNSYNVYLSYYFYITFGFYGATFNTLRQNIAYGIILLSFTYIKERKFLKFLIVIVIASSFHISAWLFLPAYFLSKIKLTIPIVGLIGIVSLIMLVFKNKIMSIIIVYFYSSYSVVQTGSYSWFIFNLFLFLLAMLFYPKKNIQTLTKSQELIKEKDMKIMGKSNFYELNNNKFLENDSNNKNTELRMYYMITLIGILFMMFTSVAENVMRVANYYYLFIILLLPAVISRVKNKYIRLLITLLLVFGIAIVYIYLLSKPNDQNDVPYQFLWK